MANTKMPAHVGRTRGLVPSRRKGGDWKPSRNQLGALRIAVVNPGWGMRSVARACGLSPETLKCWRRDPRYRKWYGEEMLAAARDFAGPALAELVRIISDGDIAPTVKIKACQVFFAEVKPSLSPEQAATSLLMDAFGSSGETGDVEIAVAARDGATGSEIAAVMRRREMSIAAMARGAAVGAVATSEDCPRTATETGARMAVRVVAAADREADCMAAVDDEGKRTSLSQGDQRCGAMERVKVLRNMVDR